MSLIAHYAELHRSSRYGDSSASIAHHVLPHVILSRAQSVLDFGCGQSRLPDIVSRYAPCARFDPAIPAHRELPAGPFDLTICIDVMEHVPESEIDDVFATIARVSRRALFIIDTRMAKQLLTDGSNAHITVKPAGWWAAKLAPHYDFALIVDIRQKSNVAIRTWPLRPGEELKIRALTLWFSLQKRLGYL